MNDSHGQHPDRAQLVVHVAEIAHQRTYAGPSRCTSHRPASYVGPKPNIASWGRSGILRRGKESAIVYAA